MSDGAWQTYTGVTSERVLTRARTFWVRLEGLFVLQAEREVDVDTDDELMAAIAEVCAESAPDAGAELAPLCLAAEGVAPGEAAAPAAGAAARSPAASAPSSQDEDAWLVNLAFLRGLEAPCG